MLSSSASETGRQIDIGGIADPQVDPGVPGGRQLTALGRGAAGIEVSTDLVDAVAQEIGAAAAVDAAAVAAGFEYLNRIVDGSGLPVGKASRVQLADTIELLGLNTFSHAAV